MMGAVVCFEGRCRDFAPAGDSLSGVPESKQRARPLLPTSLRLRLRATCADKLLRLYGKTHFELRSPFKHVAVKVMTMQLHSAVQLPAPRARRRRRGHKGQYRVRKPDSFSINFDSCYRNQCLDFKLISSQILQAVRSSPSGCACGTQFRLWAGVPQDTPASSSDLPPFV